MAPLLIAAVATLAWAAPQPPYRFGYPLFDPHYSNTPLDASGYYGLSPLQLAVLNLESAGDLLSDDILFFYPDLVTAGREVYLSSLGFGPSGTRLLWRGRPFRDLWSGLSDFSSLPPAAVGGVRSAHWGALRGVLACGGVVDLSPLRVESDEPVTSLHHRDGFYGFAPVEFVHSRMATAKTRITAGGLIPASKGRFLHSAYSGNVLYGEIRRGVGEAGELSVSYMSGLHRTELASFSDTIRDTTRTLRRGDLDVCYTLRGGNDRWVELQGYNVDSRLKDRFSPSGDGKRERSSRESGLVCRAAAGEWGGYIRLAGLSGDIGGGYRFNLTDLEGSLGRSLEYGRFKGRVLVGASGWVPHDMFPVVGLGGELEIQPAGTLSIQLKQACDPHSPRMMFEGYVNGAAPAHPDDYIIGGGRLTGFPATVTRACNIGILKRVVFGEVELSCFAAQDRRAVAYRVAEDDVAVPVTVDGRTAAGWQAICRARRGSLRASLALVRFEVRGEGVPSGVFFYPEPTFRTSWEAGWHHSYWDDEFEADVSIGGRYYGPFDAFGRGGRQNIGGAYPLDLRLTARIRRFNIYWGLHNWNSYQYMLVPGYRMMHREEYWGINWLLLN